MEEQDKQGVTLRKLRDQTERRTTERLWGKPGSRFAPCGICPRHDKVTLTGLMSLDQLRRLPARLLR